MSDEEIKKAYRSLSRKYHPDANINNPDKEAAKPKVKDVQQAYQTIWMKEKILEHKAVTGILDGWIWRIWRIRI